MYEELFQTPDRPFRATPDVRFYFAFDSMEQTRQTVLRVVRRAEGPAAVMAGVGLGKSMLAQLLAEDFKDRFDVVRLHAARLCSRRAMLQSILFELQMPYRDLSEGELRLSLMERMEPAPQHAPDGLVLIVDEAQTLPTKLLEELRLITNFARQGQARARMVLLGGMHLEETFALPEMSSFNQRLAARCFLQPMNRQQTAEFVRHQFACVHIDSKQIITRDALENVYIASEGIPRLANQVMDHALILAIANDQTPISAALIQEAWSDLQQLPMGWNNAEPAGSPPVEFGSIDDLDQDFELEPEGADDLDSRSQVAMHWPAPSDLEDFGPASPPVSHARSIPLGTALGTSSAIDHEVDCHDRTARSTMDSAKVPVESRVVFDASVMFGQSNSTPTHSNNSLLGVQTAAAATHRAFEGDDCDHDLFIFQEDQAPSTGQSSSTGNLFATWDRSSQTFTHDGPNCDGTCAGAGDDQAGHADACEPVSYRTQYAMELTLERAPNAVPMPIARATEPADGDPFGEDFDEEFAIDARDVQRWQERQRLRRQALAAQAAQSQAAQSQAAQSQSAQSQADSDQSHWTRSPQFDAGFEPTSQALASGHAATGNLVEQIVVLPPLETPFASDYVAMTAAGNAEEQLQQEIEDMISQLNFSAFSVEIDSVEHISPEFARHATSSPKYLDPQDRPGRNFEHASYPIRAEEQPTAIEITSFDDRDLLVIDEDIPASVRHSHMPVVAPTSGTMSYPELFQQLRG